MPSLKYLANKAEVSLRTVRSWAHKVDANTHPTIRNKLDQQKKTKKPMDFTAVELAIILALGTPDYVVAKSCNDTSVEKNSVADISLLSGISKRMIYRAISAIVEMAEYDGYYYFCKKVNQSSPRYPARFTEEETELIILTATEPSRKTGRIKHRASPPEEIPVWDGEVREVTITEVVGGTKRRLQKLRPIK